MRTSNFALRLQPSLMEEARAMAKSEGVALNQLINVALAEKLAASRTAAFFERYTQGANVEEALALLRRPRKGEPPRQGDELPESRKKSAPAAPAPPRARKRPATRNKSPK